MSIDFRIVLAKLLYFVDLAKLWILEDFLECIFKISLIVLSE